MRLKKISNHLLLFLLLLSLSLFLLIRNYLIEKNLEENKVESVMFVVNQKTVIGVDTGIAIEYIYNFKGDKLKGHNKITNKGLGQLIKNKYYKILFNSDNPDNHIIYLDEEITDTFKIKSAGFKMDNEIKNEKIKN
jgi:hypothetical protein